MRGGSRLEGLQLALHMPACNPEAQESERDFMVRVGRKVVKKESYRAMRRRPRGIAVPAEALDAGTVLRPSAHSRPIHWGGRLGAGVTEIAT